jgi:hypothetical protein
MARKSLTDLRVDANLIGKFSANHPDTSVAAALGIKSGTDRRKVYNVLAEHPKGLTDEEIVDLTGVTPNSERPRRGELVDMGLVENSGWERQGRSKAWAIIWRLKSA